MALTVGIDTFISKTDADNYSGNRLYSETWTNSDDATKETALKMATSIIDREAFNGTITNQAQSLAWPRTGITDQEGRTIPTDAIPTAIANATAEMAIHLLRHDLTDDRTRRAILNVQSEKVGQSQIKFNDAPDDDLPASVRALIQPFQKSGEGYSARLVP